jgi:hypothetical protein
MRRVARRGVSWLLPTTAGVVAGVGSSLLLPRLGKHVDASGVAASPSGQSVPARSARAETSGALRVGDEALRRERVARHEWAIVEHWLEPRNVAWSGRAETAFWQDLLQIAAANDFSVDEVDCGATTCVSTLEWATYGEALHTWEALLRGSYQENCTRRILLPAPDPEGSGRPYQATIVFGCGSSRRDME